MIIVAGASGQHAVVVYEAAILSGLVVTGFATVDGRSPQALLGCASLGHVTELAARAADSETPFIVAIGSNGMRRQWCEWLAARGACFQSVVHPSAMVSPSATIGPGSAILAGSIIGPRASIGGASIINHAASIDHDCVLNDYVNISPGARLAGNVRCEADVFIGLNAAILQGLRIGRGAIVGAGAVVTRDVAAASTVIGVPARVLGASHTGL